MQASPEARLAFLCPVVNEHYSPPHWNLDFNPSILVQETMLLKLHYWGNRRNLLFLWPNVTYKR